MSILKQCPFCGKNAETIAISDVSSGKRIFFVTCVNCGAETSRDYQTADAAREAWNNRKEKDVSYAYWEYDPNGNDWGLGAYLCSKCHVKNDNLPCNQGIDPYMFAGSKFCPHCGSTMKRKGEMLVV